MQEPDVGVSPVDAGDAQGDHRDAAAWNRANILLVMTDDQKLDDMRVMSRTRELIGDRGTTFSNFRVAYPICGPSRATLLTGQHAHNHGVLFNDPPTGGYDRLDHTNTLPVWLQAAGYQTAWVGKYMNHYGRTSGTERPPGWTEWYGLVDPSTYLMYGYTMNENGQLVTYGETESDYQTDVLAAKTESVLRTFSQGSEPWFVVLAPTAPHLEKSRFGIWPNPRPAPRHLGLFADEPLPRPPSFNEPDMSDKPTLSGIPQFSASEVAGLEQEHRARLESLLAVDEAVERLVNVLAELGELEQTVILFTSDNGYFSGEHRLNTKYVAYEEAVKVPLLARGPGLPQGTAVDVPTQNVDLAPTIVSIAQASPGREPDGISLLDVIERPQHYAKRALYVAAGPSEATSLRGLGYYPVYLGVQVPGLTYMRWENGNEELYDLERDPYQVSNAVQDSRYHTEHRVLSDLASTFVSCSGVACRP